MRIIVLANFTFFHEPSLYLQHISMQIYNWYTEVNNQIIIYFEMINTPFRKVVLVIVPFLNLNYSA